MLEQGEGTNIDLEKAKSWYHEAALNGYKKAIWNYALLLKKTGKEQQSKFWLKRFKHN